ncbi:thioesterase superfamily protein [Fibrisoma limi BUZ 3]|uniref:Thioesterase superfamily protein n=1 Tax=Fibrisoma limi BUZ 3 TaxID=1185876 RepID=I2GNB5_9BACT|nr:thioesterase family protein [Fibrisoma limi]CCH55393.1 thioesterase superfamily protein [Fibrisoma limi BUZ 3]
MFTYDVTDIRVRYYDTDQMGIVYYGNYARFYEIGRVEALRGLGLNYKDLEDQGIGMPVYDMKSRFIRPARYDDLLTIRVIVRELPRTRVVFQYEIYNQEGHLLNTGETTLVFLKKGSRLPVTIPDELLEVAKPFFQT